VTTLVAAAMFLALERPLLDVGARLGDRYAKAGSDGAGSA
jgi:hypothetical protein